MNEDHVSYEAATIIIRRYTFMSILTVCPEIMRLVYIIIIVFIMTEVTFTNSVCPEQFIKCGENVCFLLSNKTADWQDAHFDCASIGKNVKLAVLNNRIKDECIRSHLTKLKTNQDKRWIGGIYDWKRQTWIWWSTGEVIQYQSFSLRTPYDDNNWKCIATIPELHHKWSARQCIQKYHYICEYNNIL